MMINTQIYILQKFLWNKHKTNLLQTSETPYDGAYFDLQFSFPLDYPFKSPKIKFLTKIHHINIYAEGIIDLGILHDKWSPAILIEKRKIDKIKKFD